MVNMSGIHDKDSGEFTSIRTVEERVISSMSSLNGVRNARIAEKMGKGKYAEFLRLTTPYDDLYQGDVLNSTQLMRSQDTNEDNDPVLDILDEERLFFEGLMQAGTPDNERKADQLMRERVSVLEDVTEEIDVAFKAKFDALSRTGLEAFTVDLEFMGFIKTLSEDVDLHICYLLEGDKLVQNAFTYSQTEGDKRDIDIVDLPLIGLMEGFDTAFLLDDALKALQETIEALSPAKV
jgi:hypothetical protein